MSRAQCPRQTSLRSMGRAVGRFLEFLCGQDMHRAISKELPALLTTRESSIPIGTGSPRPVCFGGSVLFQGHSKRSQLL